MKWRHGVLGAALLVSAGLVLWGGPPPGQEIAEAVERPAGQSASRLAPEAAAIDPADTLLEIQDRTPPKGAVRRAGPGDLFRAQSWASNSSTALQLPSKPQAPVLPFTYVGWQAEGNRTVVFLAAGEDTYVVRAGDVLQEKYRVERVDASAVTFLYLPLQEVQILPLE